MAHPQPDAAEIAPVPVVSQPSPTLSFSNIHSDPEKAKPLASAQHFEEVPDADKSPARDVDAQYDGGDDDGKPRKGLRKLLRRDPSLDFMREVAEANAEELDPKEVKGVCL